MSDVYSHQNQHEDACKSGQDAGYDYVVLVEHEVSNERSGWGWNTNSIGIVPVEHNLCLPTYFPQATVQCRHTYSSSLLLSLLSSWLNTPMMVANVHVSFSSIGLCELTRRRVQETTLKYKENHGILVALICHVFNHLSLTIRDKTDCAFDLISYILRLRRLAIWVYNVECHHGWLRVSIFTSGQWVTEYKDDTNQSRRRLKREDAGLSWHKSSRLFVTALISN